MRRAELKNRDKVLLAFLLIVSLAQPLVSLTRNPDILHDAYFFSQGKALNLGLNVHTDIYSPYGPLVPWIFSITMKIFGEHLVIGRVLGLIIQLGTCLFMYSILRRKLSQLGSMLCVSLFVSLSPERTEVTSSRWIYGAGIWPTSVTILLTLNLIWIAIKLFEDEKNVRWGFVKLFLTSLLAPLLLVSRLQGILVFVIFTILVLLTLLTRIKEVRQKSLFVLSGMGTAGICLVLQMAKSNILLDTFAEMIIGPFNVTDSVMKGRWISWFTALIISMISSLIGFAVLTLILRVLVKKYDVSAVSLVCALITFIVFMFASFFDFPNEFNRNLLLWNIKVMTWIPSWIPWAIATSTVYLIIRVYLSWLKSVTVSSKKSTISLNENIFLIPIGTASFSHLFWNYSYVYNLVPITLILVIFNLDRISFLPKIKTALKVLAISQIMVFSLVTLAGFLQKSESYKSEIFMGMQDTRQYSGEIESAVNYISLVELEDSSQYFCDYSIYRYFDVDSYRIDKGLQSSPPPSRAAYLSLIADSAKRILVCGENNFFDASELNESGWVESVQRRIEANPSLSIQLLSRNGGG